MKKTILLFMLLGCITLVNAQSKSTDASQIPRAITEKFMKENPGVTPSWKMDGRNYKAFYTDPKTNLGQLMVYDDKGNVLRKESELDKLAYPAAIDEYHAKNYPGESYKLWSVRDKTGVNTYYSERNEQVLWFDKNGAYVIPKDKIPEAK